MNTQEKNLTTALDMYRSMDAVDLEAVKKNISPQAKAYFAGQQMDVEAWLTTGQVFMKAFPDGRHVFDLADAAGDYVVLHGYFEATHKGEFHGMPPTGKKIKCSMTIIDKLVDGKLVEHRGDFDGAGMMAQLTA